MAKYQCKVNRPATSWMDMTWPGGQRSPLREHDTSRVDAVNVSLAPDMLFGVFPGEGVLPTAMTF